MLWEKLFEFIIILFKQSEHLISTIRTRKIFAFLKNKVKNYQKNKQFSKYLMELSDYQKFIIMIQYQKQDITFMVPNDEKDVLDLWENELLRPDIFTRNDDCDSLLLDLGSTSILINGKLYGEYSKYKCCEIDKDVRYVLDNNKTVRQKFRLSYDMFWSYAKENALCHYFSDVDMDRSGNMQLDNLLGRPRLQFGDAGIIYRKEYYTK